MLELQVLRCSQYLQDLSGTRKVWPTAASDRLFEVKMDIYATLSDMTTYQGSSFSIWFLHPDAVSECLFSLFKKPGNRAGRKGVSEDRTGKLPPAFYSPCTVRAESWQWYSTAVLPSHHRCCHGEKTTSAGWEYRNPVFPGGCSGVTSASGEVPLCPLQ